MLFSENEIFCMLFSSYVIELCSPKWMNIKNEFSFTLHRQSH